MRGVERLQSGRPGPPPRSPIPLAGPSVALGCVSIGRPGPTGLGARRDDLWGCDFRASEGDFGDPDLDRAIEHAREGSCGRVRAVVAGHMHHALRGGGTRAWRLEREGVLYVNAARVPRIFERDGGTSRHHVELVIEGGGARASEVVLS